MFETFALIESAFVDRLQRRGETYRPQSAFLEALLSDVLDPLGHVDASQTLAVLECVIPDSLKRGRQRYALYPAPLENPAPHILVLGVLFRPQRFDSFTEYYCIETLTQCKRA